MGVIYTIIIGFVVGLVARLIRPGHDNFGILITACIGIAGAFLGSFLGQAFGVYQYGEPAGFIGAVVGAIIVLSLINMTNRRRLV